MGGGRLPVVNGKRVIQALLRAGFVVNRIVGSHHLLVYPGDPTRTVTIPVHAGRDLDAQFKGRLSRTSNRQVGGYILARTTAGGWRRRGILNVL
jgi:predicted RNA binding protein YcfA (HicA-like mRNA interferase family)